MRNNKLQELSQKANSVAKSRFFSKLRPLAVSSVEVPSHKNFLLYFETLKENQNDTDLQECLPYLLFPCQVILDYRIEVPENVKEIIFRSLSLLFGTAFIQDTNIFQHYFKTFCSLLAPSHMLANEAKTFEMSEFLKELVIDCLIIIMEKNRKDLIFWKEIETLFSCDSFKPHLGFMTSILLEFCEFKFLNRTMKVKSLKLITTLCQVCENDIEVAAKIWIPFFPGIITIVGNTISSDFRQGTDVIVTAITLWGYMISICLNSEIKILENVEVEEMDYEKAKKTLQVVCDRKWAENTAQKVHKVLTRVFLTALHPSFEVRLALCRLCGQLINLCSKTLSEKSINQSFAVLVTYIYDDYVEVQDLAKSQLEMLESTIKTSCISSFNLLETIENNFRLCLTSLPRLLRTANDSNKLSTVRLMCGYIDVLKFQIDSVFCNTTIRNKLTIALLELLTFRNEDIGVKMLEDRPHSIDLGACTKKGDPGKISYPLQKKFLYFTDKRIESAVQTLIQQLAVYCDFFMIIDMWKSIINNDSIHKKQAVYILNQVLLGAKTNLENNSSHGLNNAVKIKSVVSELVLDIFSSSDINIYQPVSQEEALLYNLNLRENEIKDNVEFVCFLIECAGSCFEILKEDVAELLLEILYPLVERLSSKSRLVHWTAYFSLQSICNNCMFYNSKTKQKERLYNSIECLIQYNFDYILDTMSRNLRFLVSNPTTPCVLAVVAKYSSKNMIFQLSDFLRDIFLIMSYDVNISSRYIHEFYSSFISLIIEMGKYIETEDKKDGDGNDTENENPNESDCRFVNGVKSILDYVKHCLPMGSTTNRILVLNVLRHGILALNPRPKILMPLIHQFWPSLLARLNTDEDMSVRLYAFEVIQSANTCCGDFVLSRIEKDVWPAIWLALSFNSYDEQEQGIKRKLSNNNNNNNNNNTTNIQIIAEAPWSVRFKMRLGVLDFLNEWVKNPSCDFKCSTIDSIVMVCFPYLHPEQPKELRAKAEEVFFRLIKIKGDILWTFFLYVGRIIKAQLQKNNQTANSKGDIVLMDSVHKKFTSLIK